MYAVLVIAAILLSVAPMHVRTILAALPAGTPGHQFTPEQADQQAPRAQSPATRQAARPVRPAHAPASQTSAPTSPVASWSPSIPAASLGLLEYAPNAP